MRRTIALLILLIMLMPLMFACGGEEDLSIDLNSSTASTDSDPEVPVKDFGGREFRVLCHDFSAGSSTVLGFTGEVIYSDENPTSIDEAKKAVVEKIQSDYNCTITGDLQASGIMDTVRNSVASGKPDYELVFPVTADAASLALDGQLTDLKTVSTIDLSAPWWDQNSVKDLSLCNKLYFVMGDINLYDNQGTWVMLFNKTLKEKLGIQDDFYQLVRDDKWNFDTFAEICRRDGISRDLNSDGIMDEKDQWAFGTERFNIYVSYVSAGRNIADKDKDDVPYLSVLDNMEATTNVLMKVLDFYNDKNTVITADVSPYLEKYGDEVWRDTVHKAFIEGRELFYMCGLILNTSFRKMKDDMGILPIPKFDPAQDRYYHTVSQANSDVMCIPAGFSESELDDIGLLASALSRESKKVVTPAYMDVQLKYRDAKDEESGEMLDIIFASRTFDVGSMYNWGGLLYDFMSLDANVVSRFEADANAARTALEQAIENAKTK